MERCVSYPSGIAIKVCSTVPRHTTRNKFISASLALNDKENLFLNSREAGYPVPYRTQSVYVAAWAQMLRCTRCRLFVPDMRSMQSPVHVARRRGPSCGRHC
jgi:hypothetical protein